MSEWRNYNIYYDVKIFRSSKSGHHTKNDRCDNLRMSINLVTTVFNISIEPVSFALIFKYKTVLRAFDDAIKIMQGYMRAQAMEQKYMEYWVTISYQLSRLSPFELSPVFQFQTSFPIGFTYTTIFRPLESVPIATWFLCTWPWFLNCNRQLFKMKKTNCHTFNFQFKIL